MTGSELVTLVRDQDVMDEILNLKRDFLKTEDSFMDIGDSDFISLVLMAPTIGVTLANGSVSLYEELSLNKKVRKLSRRSFFLNSDALTQSVKYLVKNFSKWEDRFYKVIKTTMHSSLKRNNVVLNTLKNPEALTGDIRRDILNTPYIFVKFLSFLFLEEDDDLLNERTINKVELDKIVEIGEKLEIDNVPIFQAFCYTFRVREEME
ncbi:hypothetical protein V6R21_10760 [Limibacter armeniacum]|uniref:hypothetical protein n=1 Tax=Limibacter armeniacum TaxID=466084 RepID=UPI002FE6876F